MLKYSAKRLGSHCLSEYHPGYAHLSSVIGNYAAMLTAGDHYDALLGDANIELVRFSSRRYRSYAPADKAAALGIPARMRGLLEHTGTIHVANVQQSGVGLDIIQKYEPELYAWLMGNSCGLLFSDEFACSKLVFLAYCRFLHRFLNKLRLYEWGGATLLLRTLTSIYLGRAVGLDFVGAVVCKDEVSVPKYVYYSIAEPLQMQALRGE